MSLVTTEFRKFIGGRSSFAFIKLTQNYSPTESIVSKSSKKVIPYEFSLAFQSHHESIDVICIEKNLTSNDCKVAFLMLSDDFFNLLFRNYGYGSSVSQFCFLFLQALLMKSNQILFLEENDKELVFEVSLQSKRQYPVKLSLPLVAKSHIMENVMLLVAVQSMEIDYLRGISSDPSMIKVPAASESVSVDSNSQLILSQVENVTESLSTSQNRSTDPVPSRNLLKRKFGLISEKVVVPKISKF
jgi:hypothetical protein